MALHHRRATVYIDDKAREAVALAVNQTIAGRSTGIGQSFGPTQGIGLADTRTPPSIINITALETEHPHRNGADLVVPASEKIALLAVYVHDVALAHLASERAYALYRTGKHPKMTPFERLLLAVFQKYLRYHLLSINFL